MITTELEQQILRSTGATRVCQLNRMQTLWSGYGDIVQAELAGGKYPSVVIKHVRFPKPADHPRGWQSDFAHERKLASYQVELNWYRHYRQRCSRECDMPTLIWSGSSEDSLTLIMEDLTTRYPVCPEAIGLQQVAVVLRWLAHFHATNLAVLPERLWSVGTYWHLATRPEEYRAMPDSELKGAAGLIDTALNACQYQTLVHGDAKLANFCFSDDGQAVAAVDFQYVGAGCGMKDVAYFFSSCLSSEDCTLNEAALLNEYFATLCSAIGDHLTADRKAELVDEWRTMYDVAWADFHRFLDGWSPDHWKMTAHLKTKTKQALTAIKNKR